MHSEIVARVAEQEGISPTLVEMVMTAVFTGVQQAMKHSDISLQGIDLEYFRLWLPYHSLTHRLAEIMDPDVIVKFDKYPRENYDVELLHRTLRNIEQKNPDFAQWRKELYGDFELDLETVTAKKKAYKEYRRQQNKRYHAKYSQRKR